MNDLLFVGVVFGALAGILIGGLIGMDLGSSLTYNEMMKEAYGRGHAVQCLGREGYYWECEK
jgi:hypothetical protein